MKRVTVTVKIVLDVKGKVYPTLLAERVEEDVRSSIGGKMWAIGNWHDLYVSKVKVKK